MTLKGLSMKKTIVIFTALMIFSALPLSAEDFLGAPIAPESKTKLKTESRMEIVSSLSHDEILRFYQEAMKDLKDIKFRDWKDATYIEDDGALSWHSVTISKQKDKGGTQVVIVKDNWTWIIGTLILRYIGVFAVLLVLFLGMAVSGAIISRSVKKLEEKAG